MRKKSPRLLKLATAIAGYIVFVIVEVIVVGSIPGTSFVDDDGVTRINSELSTVILFAPMVIVIGYWLFRHIAKKRKSIMFRKQSAMIAKPSKKGIEEFIIPYMWVFGDEYRNVSIQYNYEHSETIIINGESEFFRISRIEDLGWSPDHTYRKIKTPDFIAWLYPKDYIRFLRCAMFAQKAYIKKQEEYQLQRKLRAERCRVPFEPDEVTKECLSCFCVGTAGDIARYVTKGPELVKQISSICEVNGGRMFKTQAKSAKCAILVFPGARNKYAAEHYRESGYMVVTPEDFCKYFGKPYVYTKDEAQKDLDLYLKFL